MGILKPCLSMTGDSVAIGVFALYDESEAINVAVDNPGMDDLLGEPYLEDTDNDQIGDRVRPEVELRLLGKLLYVRFKEQEQDGTGNAPRSSVRFLVCEYELEKNGMLVNGTVLVRPNDRLRQILDRRGRLKLDLEADGSPGLYVVEVRPGETGSGVFDIMLEQRRPVEQ